jgi:peptide/nickel transport system permease protein
VSTSFASYFARRFAALVATLLAAMAISHVFLTAAVDHASLWSTITGVPGYLSDTFLHGDLGATAGGGCKPSEDLVPAAAQITPQCGSYGADEVADILRARVPVDVQLIAGGLLLGIVAGVAGGRHAAVKPRSKRTRALRALTAFQLSSPPYWQGFLVLVFFADTSGYLLRLPFVSGALDYQPLSADPLQYLKAMWIPWLVLALPLAAYVLRITDATLREVLAEDYLRTARAKGLTERRVIRRHALPAAAAPVAAMVGVNMGVLLVNMGLIETAFSLPGLFRLLKPAVHSQDVPVLQAMVVEGVVVIVVANFVADAVQAWLDPRVRR